MQINWKVRFRNKAWVTAFAAAILTLLYDLLDMFGVVPAVDQDAASKIVLMLIKFLVMVGVVVDPTSSGVTDSAAAMSYQSPNCIKCIKACGKACAESSEEPKEAQSDQNTGETPPEA